MATAEKPWYTSATLWLNIISVVLIVLSGVLDAAGVLHLTAQQIAYATIAVAVLNGIVRVITTNKPIAGSPAAHELRVEQRLQRTAHG